MRKKRITQILVVAFILCPIFIYAQQGGDLNGKIKGWTNNLKTIVQAVIALSALGGGLYAYFKVQSDDGGSGKKAIGNFVLALIFGALLISIIEFFIPA